MIVITTHTNADFDSLASMVPASRGDALLPGGLGRPPRTDAPRPVTPCPHVGWPSPWGTTPFPTPLDPPPPLLLRLASP